MAIGIDFLQQKRKLELKKSRFYRLLNVGSIVLLIGYLLVVLGVFSYLVSLRNEHNSINLQITQKKSKINQLNQRESLYVVLKQRLTYLNKFFSQKRANYSLILDLFWKTIPPGVFLEKIQVSQTGEISLTGTAQNAILLGNFLENLTKNDSETSFSLITLSNISRLKEGNYSFSLFLKTK